MARKATPKSWAELERRVAEIRDLSAAGSLVGWDQEVMMPPAGAGSRAHVMAALATVAHERTTDPALGRLVATLHTGRARLSPLQRRGLELTKRSVDKATCIPPDLARDLALAESRGLETWRAARLKKDWALFRPALEHMIGLKRRVAKLKAGKGRLYDALLDDYEPGATIASIDPLLDELRAITVPLVRAVGKRKLRIDTAPLVGRFDIAAQRSFSRAVVEAMGIDLQAGRLDLSTHPFCTGIAPRDVRMTSRFDEKDLRGGLFGVIHEAGHGLYEQGLDPARGRSPLGGAISMAIHESQSRLWENFIARGHPFWVHWLPKLVALHPQLKGTTVDEIWRAANIVRPSFIRVEADELTYNLHIILRYEIERDLIEGRQSVKDLPQRWNDGMAEVLGIRPRHDSEGVLQDIHWAMGLFGYFPTYSLGNLYAAQFMEAARAQIRGLDKRIAKGDLHTLRDWLHDNIHRHDQVYTAEQICRRVTGKVLDTEAFARHIRGRLADVYGV